MKITSSCPLCQENELTFNLGEEPNGDKFYKTLVQCLHCEAKATAVFYMLGGRYTVEIQYGVQERSSTSCDVCGGFGYHEETEAECRTCKGNGVIVS